MVAPDSAGDDNLLSAKINSIKPKFSSKRGKKIKILFSSQLSATEEEFRSVSSQIVEAKA